MKIRTNNIYEKGLNIFEAIRSFAIEIIKKKREIEMFELLHLVPK